MLNRFVSAFLTIAAAVAFVAALPTVAATHPVVAMVATATSGIPMFDTEAAAQRHCPSDTVVWLNTKSGIYHEKGMRWYGRTRHGAYVCRKEADAAGYRDTRNGQ